MSPPAKLRCVREAFRLTRLPSIFATNASTSEGEFDITGSPLTRQSCRTLKCFDEGLDAARSL
jgi:hypothetical protein